MDDTSKPTSPLWGFVPGVLSVGLLLLIAWVAIAISALAGRSAVPPDSARWMEYTVDRLHQGQIPLWYVNEKDAPIGMPFVAMGKTAVFYPTTLLHLYMPAKTAWTLSAVLQMWIAATGAWLLAGRWGRQAAARMIAAQVFMFCAVQLIGVNLPQTNTLIWLPWALLVVDRLIEKVSSWRILAAALVFAVQFLAGHAPASALLVSACLLLYLFRIHRGVMAFLKGIGPLAMALAIGIALAGVQILPWWDFWRHSVWGDVTWLKWEGALALGGTVSLLFVLAVVVRSARRDRPFVSVAGFLVLVSLVIAILGQRHRLDSVPRTQLLIPARLALWAGDSKVFESLPEAFLSRRVELCDSPKAAAQKIKDMPLLDPKDLIIADGMLSMPLPEDSPADFWKRKSVRPLTTRGTATRKNLSGEEFLVTFSESKKADGWLVIKQLYDGGWRAWAERGGEGGMLNARFVPIVPAYAAIQAVPLSGVGAQGLHFQYRPRAWTMGLFATGAGGLAVLMLLAWGLFPNETDEETNDAGRVSSYQGTGSVG